MKQLELFAESIRRAARVGPEEIVDAPELATRLIGPDCVVLLDRLACGARLRHTPAGYRIELRDGLPDMNFACAHELAHWALRELEGYCGPDEERFANFLGAALLAPRALVRTGLVFYGRRLEAVDPLAESVWISRTAANLRLGEVANDARVVVTRTGNVLRNDLESFPEPDIEIVAKARRRTPPKGIARAELHGGIDEARIAMRGRK